MGNLGLGLGVLAGVVFMTGHVYIGGGMMVVLLAYFLLRIWFLRVP